MLLGSGTRVDCVLLVVLKDPHALSLLVKSTPVRVGEALAYVMGRLGSFISLAIVVPSHRVIPLGYEAVWRAFLSTTYESSAFWWNSSESFPEQDTFSVEHFCFPSVLLQYRLEASSSVSLWIEKVFCNPSCCGRSVFSFTLTTL